MVDKDEGWLITFNEFADYCLKRNINFEKKLIED